MHSETTNILFEKTLFERGISEELNLPPNRIRQLRNSYKLGKVSIEKKHEILTAAGYQICQEEKWSKGANKEDKLRYRKIRFEMQAFGYDFKRLSDHDIETLLGFIATTNTGSEENLNEFILRIKNI